MPKRDADSLIQRALALSPAEQAALLDALMGRVGFQSFDPPTRPEPDVRPAPREVRGLQIRIDLQGAKPPVWRRVLVPGDLPLDQLSRVVLAAMGWQNCHLHQFRTGSSRNSAAFVTAFDRSEGEEGTLEDDVRVDQVLTVVADRLWYDYDFGDGWEHVLKVEKVLAIPPTEVAVLAGRRACPPEDAGGIDAYAALADWVQNGYDPAQLPENFDDAEHARAWLPPGWHPDHFSLDEARAFTRDLLG